MATNLRSRLKHHLRDRHGRSWERFSVYLTIGDSHLKEMESLILRIVKPPGNKQKGKFAKSEDIRRKFARDIRRKQRTELRDLLGKAFDLHPTDETDDHSGGKPALGPYISGPMAIRALFKGQILKARVRRDGRIRFHGKLYNSPSLAGRAAVKRRTCNGWWFWRYERAPGDWVLLDNLRR